MEERDYYVSDEYIAEFERELNKLIEELSDDYVHIPYEYISQALLDQAHKYLKKSNK